MFIATDTLLFKEEVRVSVPSAEEAGKREVQTFVMDFEALPSEETEAIAEQIRTAKSTAELIRLEIDQLVRVSRGWQDVVGVATNKPLPFSEDALRKLCRFAPFRRAVGEAYARGLNGDGGPAGN
ncbi:hypothetical protein C8N35_102142 [Breoghania corrubedonensis]|uniref:Uncharacterized protein n=1 Tax=Breoghania corrubedonensis TaxID=665038 RepID=A0A2T5VCE1_9HYPH|nr:hypothetical protein [Breoghania corrubedonensis]PTW61433.1 hypothetical protein C8N35_102142 [Breoghania corrubedonensis]